MTLILVSLGLYVFANRRAYAWRYVYPGVAGMGLFVLFPLICTIAIAFTNYSSTNQLTFERAQSVLLDRQFQTGKTFTFGLYPSDNQWRLQLTNPDDGSLFISEPFSFEATGEQKVMVAPTNTAQTSEPASLRIITQSRQALSSLVAILPDGAELRMSSLRQFSGTKPLYTLGADGKELINQQTGVKYWPNPSTGFYQAVNADGQWENEKLSPGFTVSIGWKNFLRVLHDEGIQKPFISIFIWTILFSVMSVTFTVAVGMVLACVVQWDSLKGKAIYRVMLILPYAVPSFISILIFKGLFNQSFGEINLMLSHYLASNPPGSVILSPPKHDFDREYLARLSLHDDLCMGLLKAIPDDLYEASAMDGAGPFQNFFRITFPLLIKPLTPLMIASFAFNFNNFVLIQLLTNGGPDMIGTSTPAGYTDLLVNYTYRVAFEGEGGQDFGLAAAIATLIFILVGALAILNLKASKMNFD